MRHIIDNDIVSEINQYIICNKLIKVLYTKLRVINIHRKCINYTVIGDCKIKSILSKEYF